MSVATTKGGKGLGEQAPHLVELCDGWALWRTVCVRGTGFPVDMLEALAAPEAVAATDRLIEAEAARDAARAGALGECRRLITETDAGARAPLRRVRRQLSKGRAPDPPPGEPELATHIADFAAALIEVEEAREEAETGIEAAQAFTLQALRDVGRDPLFREALAWQNRMALKNNVDTLLRMPAGARDGVLRAREQLIVNYLQRYCAKNESIGFFGPIGWAQIADQGRALSLKPGPGLVSDRFVHFEYWAVDALAKALTKERWLRPWLAPRLNPLVRLDGNAVVGPTGKRLRLVPAMVAALAACDGETRAIDIAEALVADPATPFEEKKQVYAVLSKAALAGGLIWALEVPVAPHPERVLRGALERVGDEDLRARLTAPLDELEAARDAVAAAAGDDSALDQALVDLETRFTRLTGKRPTRHEGASYAGRTLVYEDCRRDIEMTLGPEFSERLGPPLSLLLQSARWFTYKSAERILEHADIIFARLQGRAGAKTVDFVPFFARAVPKGFVLRGTARKLQARWAEILAVEDDARSVEFTSAELRDRVAAAFSAPHPGFPFGRYHSPDVMIAAESVEAVRRGNYRLVLGELHAGVNSLLQTIFVLTHPRPGDVIATHKCDVPGPQIYPVMPRSYGKGYRMALDSYADEDIHLVMDDTPSWRPPDRVLRIADLVVEKADGQLFVRTRDGGKRFHIIEVFHVQLRGWCALNFSLLPPAAHRPRVTIDGLVVARESWRFPCRDLAFAWEKRESARFIGARRWAAAQDLPRWVFARFPQERKPVYVDLESPACVELMAKLARRAGDKKENAPISVSEMLPTPEQAWLIDAEGRRYTSELRVVAVDPMSWRRP